MENLGLMGFTGAGANRLFAALTGLDVPSEYEETVGVASLPDERLDRLAERSKSKKIVHAGFELVNLALPPGSKPGEGLGAKFIGSLRNCDAILIVLRAFDDGTGAPQPEEDLAALEMELVLADLGSVEQRLTRQKRAAKSGDKEIIAEVASLERAHELISAGTPMSKATLSEEERAHLAPVFLLTTKPLLVVRNTGEEPGEPVGDELSVPINIEAELATMEPDDEAEMRESYGLGPSALTAVAQAAYGLLGRSTFLTTGEDESRAWTFRNGSKAPECAGVIHSDLQRGFIRAEVINWQELLDIGSWAKAKEAKKIRLEGKDYVVQDGDVLEIRFNV
jgi:ribosome-binding ATPase YchF (GTP1/OBG family)